MIRRDGRTLLPAPVRKPSPERYRHFVYDVYWHRP